MAGGVNKVILIGNLGRDPELRVTPNGHSVCQLSVATTRTYTKGNDRVEETEWHRVVVWGKQAEHCANYLAKGRQVYVEGRIQTRSYDDKDGNKRYSTEIVADTVQFLGGRGEGGGAPRQSSGRAAQSSSSSSAAADPGFDDSYIPSDPGDDDIPF